MIENLKHDTWLNRATRAVFVDFAVYNCNINVVCAVNCRFTDSEVENILNKYGIEPQKMVHEDEAKQMFRDVLQNAPESSNKDDEDTSNASDINWLIKRVDLLENVLEDVHNKCDIVIARLDAIRVQLPPNYAEQNLQNNPTS
ncbi:PREDICTED: uncharacterized protein LOC107172297 [Diuraphis noxia]|uniref:uncharacterized protein LOC107172297 n=1 Tax=Diuraphis noxia TaxID=143948 RepID=UPI000763682C|nr:PREDICTED: uncharacterized protein LOC107172297 [Diuraphis noxia]